MQTNPRSPITGVVLAVDDTPGNLRVLLEVLGSVGHEVLVATDGKSALETARYAHPDLILLDVLMPGMDGYETCAKLKADETTNRIPIIFMTALSETAEKVRAFDTGAVDYITKPFEHSELLARVNTHLIVSRLGLDLEKRNHELEELNRIKGEFMSMAAHDVRNPLASVVACADLIDSIIESAPPEKIRRFVSQISAASRRINTIITNLLDVDAIDLGQRRLALTAKDLNEVAANVVEQNRVKAREKNIEIEFVAPPEPAMGLIDINAAEQVLENIISNAVKYSPPGREVRVKLSATSDVVRIEVSDQGPGISEDDQRQMFGKFRRLTAQPTAGEPSTGLGLWIVKRLTEAMNGTIACQSSLGHGTTFIASWPRTQSVAVAA